MLKRLPVDRLRPGMFLHGLCGSWLDHPFWRTSFRLASHDIALIRASGIAQAWIDTSKGDDVDEGHPVPPVLPTPAAPQRAIPGPVAGAGESSPDVPDLPQTLTQALEVREHARQAVSDLFAQARMGVALDTAHCMPVVEQIVDQLGHNNAAMLNVLRIKHRDEYTYLHSVAVCALMVSLGRALGLDEQRCREAGLAGLLHDVGKAVVPLDILVKPGRLTQDEYRVIQGHAAAGHALLSGARLPSPIALDVCLNHHEKVDGSGYPRGLPSGEISLFAKMGAVCDVYDAVTSNRPYKDGWDPGEALRQMVQWKGHFDPAVFQAFVKAVGIYPVGSLVRLRSQRLAVVVAQHADMLLRPVVQPVFDLSCMQPLQGLAPLDLREAAGDDAVVASESPAEWAQRGVVVDMSRLGWPLDP